MSTDRIDRIKAMIQARGGLEPPEAAAIDPEVRTGETFVLTGLGRGSTAPGADRLRDLVKKGVLLGGVVVTWGYDVPRENGETFAAWLRDNEGDLARLAPKGVHYRGTYGVFSSTEKGSGRYRTVWAYEGIDAFQAMQTALAEGGEIGGLIKQLNDFRDQSRDAEYSQEILTPAAAAKRM